MKTIRKQLALLCAIVLILTASLFHIPVKAQTFNEGFETGTKTSYADATVQLSTGLWDFNEALLQELPLRYYSPQVHPSSIQESLS